MRVFTYENTWFNKNLGEMEGILQKKILKIERNHAIEKQDLVVLEEPLEIRIGFGAINNRQKKRIAVTMRTPGNDLELALGFLFTEGIIRSSKNAILSIEKVPDLHKSPNDNIVKVELSPSENFDIEKLDRNFYVSSSCGICGKAAIESVYQSNFPELLNTPSSIDPKLLHLLPTKLKAAQSVFQNTGGLHAAALFDFHGNLLALREDIGRHNAVDKVIGWAFQHKLLPLSQSIIMVSGRAGFELVQKSLMAGIPVMAAVGAPSSLAIELAEEAGMTLIGFLKKETCNVYCHSDRLKI